MHAAPWGDFVFAQSRLQARHAALLDPGTWSELEQITDYGQFLQTVRQTPLSTLVQSFGAFSPIDDMETALRGAFAARVAETASWVPERWQPAVHFVRTLPTMLFRRHMRAHERYDWMSRDPELADTASHHDTQEGGEVPAEGTGSEARADEIWMMGWRHLWPEEASELEEIGERLAAAALPTLGGGAPWPQRRAELRDGLKRAFRHHAFGPGAAFAHLGLVCLELGRLRGNLSARRARLVA